MREACIPAANGHFTAKALAVLYDSFLESLGLSDGRTRRSRRAAPATTMMREQSTDGRASGVGGAAVLPPSPLLSRSRVNEMRCYQVMIMFIIFQSESMDCDRLERWFCFAVGKGSTTAGFGELEGVEYWKKVDGVFVSGYKR